MNTGERELNRRIHGNIRALVEQARDKNFDFYEMKELMKFLAAEFEGYPKVKERIRYKGKIIERVRPASLAGQPNNIAYILCQTIQAFADERGLYLYEYDENGNVYRSVGGRSKKEMKEYIEFLIKTGRKEEAEKLQKPIRKDFLKDNNDKERDKNLIDFYNIFC